MNFIENVRAELGDFIQESGKSQKQIAKETGLSSSIISQFLSGVYTGDNTETATTISKYLTVGKQRLNAVQTTAFSIEMHNTEKVLINCNYAHKYNEITLVTGDAGAGKTTALRHYEEHNTGVIFVTANSCTRSATAVLNLICENIGKGIAGRKAIVMQHLVEQLKGSNRLLIIDEADHLSLDALQAIRNLNDLAKIGIVLSGNRKIMAQMQHGVRGYEFDQIRTRIIMRTTVENNYTPEELRRIFKDANDEALGVVLRLANRESLRTARKIYEMCAEYSLANGAPLTAKLIAGMQKQYMGFAV